MLMAVEICWFQFKREYRDMYVWKLDFISSHCVTTNISETIFSNKIQLPKFESVELFNDKVRCTVLSLSC